MGTSMFKMSESSFVCANHRHDTVAEYFTGEHPLASLLVTLYSLALAHSVTGRVGSWSWRLAPGRLSLSSGYSDECRQACRCFPFSHPHTVWPWALKSFWAIRSSRGSAASFLHSSLESIQPRILAFRQAPLKDYPARRAPRWSASVDACHGRSRSIVR